MPYSRLRGASGGPCLTKSKAEQSLEAVRNKYAKIKEEREEIEEIKLEIKKEQQKEVGGMLGSALD